MPNAPVPSSKERDVLISWNTTRRCDPRCRHGYRDASAHADPNGKDMVEEPWCADKPRPATAPS